MTISASRERLRRQEKLAQVYDDQIFPVWGQRFVRMMTRTLAIPDGGQVLDIGCRTGALAVEVVRRMGPKNRLIAIDTSASMVDIARHKVDAKGGSVFFRTESDLSRLSFADDVYDVVLCNLALAGMTDPGAALIDFARVTKPDGRVVCSLPLAGTFQEFYDIYREVLVKHDKHDTLGHLNRHIREAYPTPETCVAWMSRAGLGNIDVEVEDVTLLFRSSREFFFAPVIEHGPLSGWKAIAGHGQEMQDIFWYIKEAIDAYFEGAAFEVTVKAGCFSGDKLGEVATAPALASVERDTAPDMVPPVMVNTPALADSGSMIEVELDAFVPGRRRPSHLSD